jgi:hypothetical protein
MKRSANCGTTSLKALGLILAWGAVAHASLPYLAVVGPPPLRLLASKKPHAAVIKIETLATAATNTLAAVEAKALPAATNTTGGDQPAGPAPFNGLAADRSLEETFSASVFALPTPDLLSITPQMLATYFHPVEFGTNSGPAAGALRVSFMPPLPPAPEPVKSSHAEYLVK